MCHRGPLLPRATHEGQIQWRDGDSILCRPCPCRGLPPFPRPAGVLGKAVGRGIPWDMPGERGHRWGHTVGTRSSAGRRGGSWTHGCRGASGGTPPHASHPPQPQRVPREPHAGPRCPGPRTSSVRGPTARPPPRDGTRRVPHARHVPPRPRPLPWTRPLPADHAPGPAPFPSPRPPSRSALSEPGLRLPSCLGPGSGRDLYPPLPVWR